VNMCHTSSPAGMLEHPVNILNSDFHRSLHINFGMQYIENIITGCGTASLWAICLCRYL